MIIEQVMYWKNYAIINIFCDILSQGHAEAPFISSLIVDVVSGLNGRPSFT